MLRKQNVQRKDHKSHPVIPLKEEYEVKTAQLGKIEAEVKQLIQERQKNIQDIKDTVKRSKADADREIADGVQVLTALMRSIEKCQEDLNQMVKEKLKSTVKQAEDLIKELEQEIEDLTNRSSEVKQLSHTKEHLHFLQAFRSLKVPPPTRDWTTVEVPPPSYIGTLRRSLDQLEETLNMEMRKLSDAELKRVQKYEVDVTLDPDAAHLQLILSEDGKQVHDGGVEKRLPDNPKRLSRWGGVLTRQSFSSGRFYFEVQVKDKTAWRLGVVRESIDRKGGTELTPVTGYWTLLYYQDVLVFSDIPDVRVPLRAELQKVGVFVDYDEGLVSFYDVEARVHLYSATGCTFSEPLYPLLDPGPRVYEGNNSAPLIISPVNQTDWTFFCTRVRLEANQDHLSGWVSDRLVGPLQSSMVCIHTSQKGMASASTSWPEENFSCSICLDVFSSPVSTTCGHNFCRTCITKFWDGQVKYKCPVCNKLFNTRPDLRVNILFSEMVDRFGTSLRVKEQPCVEPGEVPCDVCTGTQLKAVKSCLVCLISYCQTHLEPHQRVAGLKKHRLVEPMDRLDDRMCKKHDRLLELFCKTEQVCVCQFCKETDHKSHLVKPLKEEYEVKTAQLGKIEAEVKQLIQERQKNIREIKDTVKRSKADADREIADGVQVLTALMRCIEKCQDDLNQMVKEKLKSTEKQAEDLIKELEQEIEDLTNRISEVKQLSHTKDHFHFLQAFRSLKDPPPTRDWTTVEVRPPSYVGTLRRSLDQLEETLNMEMKKLRDAKLKRVLQYEVDVTLDPNTAHPRLILSEDGKQVHDGGVEKRLPDNPKRFKVWGGVLTRQSFSSGRFYFEVQVKDKSYWCLGVARESIDRKGWNSWTPGTGYWTLHYNEYVLVFSDNPSVCLPLRAGLQKVGVFVDYDEGVVSFYDVEARVHLYSATGCTFSEPLYPLLCLCTPVYLDNNSAPLIISPVNQTD
ncbi:E3 ubiquitin-protein ligase TRIM39-like [Gadus macrocephalus]|uniref:E3 ubiquitin-protein ligase TRIM39-like n=1 Tax=Gadus macrocephalus TaxID=80720 RepID=UPI0028CB9CE9|nr:E3 ubiquitin-protein ligase TRIM39-like [Gadus macrocephalus]